MVILLATVKGLYGFNLKIVLTGCQLLEPIFKTLRTHKDFIICFSKI